MKILVLNSGSSSIKFKLYKDDKAIAVGLVERIGEASSKVELKNIDTDEKFSKEQSIKNHEEGLSLVNELFKQSGLLEDLNTLDGCGHRAVQGGAKIMKHCLVTQEVIDEMDKATVIAPLHNPANLAGIRTMIKKAPNVPNVAVFDTAFHATVPDYAYMYALPYEYYEKENIRRYGYHGTSHSYVSRKAAEFLGIGYDNFNVITAHLGNGASISAIKNGKCIDTSMGLTPLEGLMMGTRCGDLDPAIVPYIQKVRGLSPNEVDTLMNKKSGFLGICGYNDLRDVDSQRKKGDDKARLAVQMYAYRLAKYIGSYFAILPKTDALVFTAGVGENASFIRKETCDFIKHLGFDIDDNLNNERSSKIREIGSKNAKLKILVVPTDEEFEIANTTKNLIYKK
ncbi:acetate kinase [uncultured Campylobacter sp.]|uniref:acetate/propionate family kinase n=1 Tax=uncultured Campylobacter sp. TaxID=218934 RepID=UPI002620E214|nr:acetate kinase [uncultured Campylobacter sp.]